MMRIRTFNLRYLVAVTGALLLFACSHPTPEERQARKETKERFQGLEAGDVVQFGNGDLRWVYIKSDLEAHLIRPIDGPDVGIVVRFPITTFESDLYKNAQIFKPTDDGYADAAAKLLSLERGRAAHAAH